MRENRIPKHPKLWIKVPCPTAAIAKGLMCLRNGKNNVDLALPVRLANLPAGAKLDIYKMNAAEGISNLEEIVI